MLFGVSGLFLTVSLCFLTWRIGADLRPVQKLMAEVSNPPPLSTWTTLGLTIGRAIWLVPLASASGIVMFSGARWGLHARVIVICTLFVALWVLFMILNVGLYSPVEWFMQKVL